MIDLNIMSDVCNKRKCFLNCLDEDVRKTIKADSRRKWSFTSHTERMIIQLDVDAFMEDMRQTLSASVVTGTGSSMITIDSLPSTSE